MSDDFNRDDNYSLLDSDEIYDMLQDNDKLFNNDVENFLSGNDVNNSEELNDSERASDFDDDVEKSDNFEDILSKDESDISDNDIDELLNMLNSSDFLKEEDDDVPFLKDALSFKEKLVTPSVGESLDSDDILKSSYFDGSSDSNEKPSSLNKAAEDRSDIESTGDLLSQEQSSEMEALLKSSLSLGVSKPDSEMSDADIEELISRSNFTSLFESDSDDPMKDFFNDPTVYDGTVKKQPASKKESSESKTTTVTEQKPKNEMMDKISQEVNKIPMKFFIIPAAVVGGIAVILTILTVIANINYNKMLKERGLVAISQSEYMSNDTNFIFVSDSQPFEDGELKLIKLLMDSIASKFYFDKYFDVMQYEITLTDVDNKLYNIDLAFSNNNQVPDNKEPKPVILRFDPIDDNVNEITLILKSLQTGRVTQYNLLLKERLIDKPLRYLTSKQNVETGDPSIRLSIEDAVFSSTGSVVNYKFSWDSDNELVQIGNDGVNSISLEEGAKWITPSKYYPAQYLFSDHNILIGRMDYEPIRNLNSKVSIIFDNIYKKINLDDEFLAEPLFLDSPENQISINVRPYRLVFERMGLVNDSYICVYHAEDFRIKPNDEGVDTQVYERIEAKINAQLLIRNDNGMELYIDGKSRSKKEGGDITFPLNNLGGLLTGGETEEIYLKINSVLIPLDKIKVPIDLKNQSEEKVQSNLAEANDFILSAFNSRLAVKSGTLNKDYLSNLFTTDILNGDDRLSADYEVTNTEAPAIFNSQIITSAISDDNKRVYAVVQDTWKGSSAQKDVLFYRTHKIIAENINNSWIIKEDNILR